MKTEIEVIFEMAKAASKKDEEIERLRKEVKDLEAVVRSYQLGWNEE
jgi:archaellum component FlaC